MHQHCNHHCNRYTSANGSSSGIQPCDLRRQLFIAHSNRSSNLHLDAGIVNRIYSDSYTINNYYLHCYRNNRQRMQQYIYGYDHCKSEPCNTGHHAKR